MESQYPAVSNDANNTAESEAIRAAKTEIHDLEAQLLETAGKSELSTWSSWPTIRPQLVEKCDKFEHDAEELLAQTSSSALSASEFRKRFLFLDLDYSSCRRILGLGVNALTGTTNPFSEPPTAIRSEGPIEVIRHHLMEMPTSLTAKPAPSSAKPPLPAPIPIAAAPAQPAELPPVVPVRVELAPVRLIEKLAPIEPALMVLSAPAAIDPPEPAEEARASDATEADPAPLEHAAPKPILDDIAPMQTELAQLRSLVRDLSEEMKKQNTRLSQWMKERPDPNANGLTDAQRLADELRAALKEVHKNQETSSLLQERGELQERVQSLKRQLAENSQENNKLSGEFNQLRIEVEATQELLRQTENGLEAEASLENELRGLRREMEFREKSLQDLMVKQDAARLEEIFKLRASVEQLELRLKLSQESSK